MPHRVPVTLLNLPVLPIPPTPAGWGWAWVEKPVPGLNWCGGGKDAVDIEGWKPCNVGKDVDCPGVGINPFPAPGPASNPRLAPILGCNFPKGVAFAPVAILDMSKFLSPCQTSVQPGINFLKLSKYITNYCPFPLSQYFNQNGAQQKTTKDDPTNVGWTDVV